MRRAAQKVLHIIILHVAALEVIDEPLHRHENDEDDIEAVGEHRLELLFQGDAVGVAALRFRVGVLDDALLRVVVLHEKERNGADGHGNEKNGIPLDIVLQPEGNENRADDEADDDARDERPAQLAHEGELHLLLGIVRDEGDDAVAIGKEVGRSDRMIARQQDEEIHPICLTEEIGREKENENADDDRQKAENEIPRAHSALFALGVREQPAVEDADAHHEDARDHHDELIFIPHRLCERVGGSVRPRRIGEPHHLHEELLDEPCDGVDDEDHPQRPDEVPEDLLLTGDGAGLYARVEQLGIEDALAK